MFRRCPDFGPRALAPGLALIFALLAATPAPLAAQAVVQAMPDPAAAQLRTALQRLATRPGDIFALRSAGMASLQLDDVDAAEGFFARLLEASPNDPEAMIGLAVVSLRREDAIGALRYFQRAKAAGGNLEPWASERGLAYDLVGANRQAQTLYKQALAGGEDNEIVRRLALSYAISGDGPASEAMLLPLLQRRDAAAYRTRAFALAILGRDEESVSIARTMLPAPVANRLVPYLLKMPRLTPAQQAAAANLGVFPDSRQIGRDDPALATMAREDAGTAPARATAPGSRLVPEGQALGTRPAIDPLAPPPLSSPPAPAPPPQALPARTEPAPVVVAQTQQPAPAPVSQSSPAPLPAAKSFVDAFEVYGPVDAPARSAAQPGVTSPPPPPAQPIAKEPAKPAHPARYWVQLGIGRNLSAFPFDWRKKVRQAGGLLDDMELYRGPATGTNRMLTGPFESAEKAQEMVTSLKAAGVDALRYRSTEGEEIIPLK